MPATAAPRDAVWTTTAPGRPVLEVLSGGPDCAEGTVTSVDKALAVLEAFRGPGTVLGVTEVARRGNLSKSTAHRMLGLLVDRGYVERRGIGYALGSMLFELGNSTAFSRARSLRVIAMPYMIELLNITRAAVHLASLVGGDVLFLERVFGHRDLLGVPEVGSRVPAPGTAPGDVIREFSGSDPQSEGDPQRLREIRRRRVAHQEWSVGHTALCVSAPVVAASSGRAVAAISVVLRRDQSRTPGIEAEPQRAGLRIGEGF